MNKLIIDSEIRTLFPNVEVGLLSGRVQNSLHQEELWEMIEASSSELRKKHTFESIREIQPIHSGKKAYRLLGKDPNRYRVSAEAMIRRIVKGQSLYQIHTLVDVLNLVSIKSGVTIGGFDLDALRGDITLGVGKENEEFDAIGRGLINISRLPIYRDESGPIGSPTSDCTRTMLQPDTSQFLMIITDFFGESLISPVFRELTVLLAQFANAEEVQNLIYK